MDEQRRAENHPERRRSSGRSQQESRPRRRMEDRPQMDARNNEHVRRTTPGRTSNTGRTRKNSRRKRRRNAMIRVGVLMFLIMIALGTALYWLRYGPSKEKADQKEYYGISQENQLAVIVGTENLKAQGMLYDGRPYIEYTAVRDYLNERFYWDANENILLYTLPTDVVSVGVGNSEYVVGTAVNAEGYVILKTEGPTAYIALDFIQKYTNFDYEIFQNPNRVVITSGYGEIKEAVVRKDTQVRVRGGVKSPVLTELNKKDTVTFIENEGDWKKVRTDDGYIGYVKGNCLKEEQTKKLSRAFEEPQFTSIKRDRTINMAWNMVTNQSANSGVLETIANTKGLTTLVPTWFSVQDTMGNLISIASPEYVNYAHQSGIEVWAMVNDFDHGFGGLTTAEEIQEMLSYTSRRENLTNQLIAAAIQTGVDGINVDFEHIYTEESGFHFIQFIRELSVKCRKNNLVLSVDNYVPQGYNTQYHRKEQGIFADYVVIMGYDEHQSNSYESGSVASYDFVKEGIENTLKEVPAEKVINAVPFYTRLWSERPKTEAELAEQKDTEAAQYPMAIECETLGMADAQARVASAGVTAVWDETTRQNYAEWDGADGKKYKIWLEDAASLEEKLKLMKEYQLAGTGAWRIGYETPDIWELILKYVN